MKKEVISTNTVPIFIQNKTFPFADIFFKEKKKEIISYSDLKRKSKKRDAYPLPILLFSVSQPPTIPIIRAQMVLGITVQSVCPGM